MLNNETGRQYTILAPGFAKWWGCDPRALARAFRGLGHTLLEVDAEDYVPWRWDGFVPKVLRRLSVKFLADDYNRAVLSLANTSSYDFILVFKGMHLRAETLRALRSCGKPVYNFYPDLSFMDHGNYIPAALRYYDCVFTTKSFHGEKEKNELKIRDLVHVQHGFDPEVHRPVRLTPNLIERYGCDVSFVGCWSPEKEDIISHILKKRRNLKLFVYGIGWKYASAGFRQALGQNLRPGVFGDELAIVYSASRVNLGLLSSGSSDPSVRDQTTVRTFQIPASRAFMIHEDTQEVRSYFRPDVEVMLFKDKDDLILKLDMAIGDKGLREAVGRKGYERCISVPYDYSNAARRIIRYFEFPK